MRITVFDYGAGNLHSLAKALALPDVTVSVESDPARCTATDLLVLPGVGGFAQAASRLAAPGTRLSLRDALRDGLPCVAICLGMQLLYERSDEGEGDGLGLLPGAVTRLRAARVPQIGWNTLDDAADPLLERSCLRVAYYANSYVCRGDDDATVRAWSTHETDRFPAMVRIGRTVGVQFHPEKSSAAGVRLLREAVAEARA